MSVECTPKVIGFSEATIIVTSDTAGTGYIKVTDPNRESRQIPINVAAGVPLQKLYPTDFGGSTELSGLYEVEVHLNSGQGGKAIFWVGFTVVAPEYPFGTITALLLSMVALATIKMRH